jgi:hypothetical protein
MTVTTILFPIWFVFTYYNDDVTVYSPPLLYLSWGGAYIEMVYASFPYVNQWVGCVPTAAPHYQWPPALFNCWADS